MTTMKFVYALAVLFLAVILSDAANVDCNTYCAISSCAGVTQDSCDGTIIRKGGYCGCCDLCQKTVSRGESCDSTTSYIPPKLVCGSGTFCTDGVCQ